MKIQALQKVVYNARSPVVVVDVVEDIACGLHRQRGDFRASAVGRDCFFCPVYCAEAREGLL